ncbi:DNA-binding response regulator, OmpR family, contains REC and winged-helix (wHTH) domain [Paenibacillus tianmuensis]|uniref:DNA-binding response regulator, OmpR family, contains REC and winged-helix (WHTH) domain n=1 Tax=Paenibacillus tianmuensis TaxID=624147 RepID=A0A1G4QB69_9BACL|nr:response regulator transcription factor [Paenibacillus tianmuensis]SCW41816.1 DNA-binding response regulator, OmpR family, contains REC and winged-helix (wHTH) domain [Paenibacillus tianmuensis]
MTQSILVIEDEEHIARVLTLELEHEGYKVETAHDGREGARLATSKPWSLILLDVMLPEWNGLEVLRRIRQVNAEVPVILLTARDATPDIVSGFDQGANDYITKPFVIEELLARVRNLIGLTNRQKPENDTLSAADLAVDLKARKVTRGGNPIELTPKEFDLLQYLIQHKGHVLARDQIISDVWGYDFVGDTNIVDVYIRYLRQKVDKGYQPKLIKTARGVGYELTDPEL